jgi:hypothetical protein
MDQVFPVLEQETCNVQGLGEVTVLDVVKGGDYVLQA